MKPPKPVRLYPKSRQFVYELHAIFEQAGLEAEDPDDKTLLYWKDLVTNKRYRIGEDLLLQVSGKDFDRWALESVESYALPLTDTILLKLLEIVK